MRVDGGEPWLWYVDRDGTPDLVVEILSPSSRRYDRVTKLRWYAQLGVPEYWLVDPDARTLERLDMGELVSHVPHGPVSPS